MDLLLAARRCFVAVALVAPLTLASPAGAQVFEVLSSFRGANATDGIRPHTVMIPGPDGSLYGTTPYDDGAPAVIYRLTLEGVRTIVYRFQDDFGTSYCSPQGRLAVGLDAALYGLAAGCGTATEGGILFRLAGTSLSVLHRFDSPPSAGLGRGLDGAVYGATWGAGPGRGGVIFKWDGAFTIVHNLIWNPASLPPAPFAPDYHEVAFGEVTLGRDGSLYLLGGTQVTTPPLFASVTHAVLRITPANAVEHVADFGAEQVPAPAVMLATDGSLCGSFVKWVENRLPESAWLYCNGALTQLPSNWGAQATLVEGLNGSIYGALESFPAHTIFRRRADGSMTTLHTFDEFGGSGPRYPTAGLTRGSDGHLYGTTFNGGDSDLGVVFRLRMPAEADASANGRQGPLTLGPSDPLQVSFAFHAGLTNVQDQAELYAAVVTPSGATYWMKPDGSFTLAPTRLYAGALPSFPAMPLINLPSAGVLPAGDYYWVMIVDADANGAPDGTYVDFVKTTRR
jgi:uncharacterized repeat protein (TIGR03803 family)